MTVDKVTIEIAMKDMATQKISQVERRIEGLGPVAEAAGKASAAGFGTIDAAAAGTAEAVGAASGEAQVALRRINTSLDGTRGAFATMPEAVGVATRGMVGELATLGPAGTEAGRLMAAGVTEGAAVARAGMATAVASGEAGMVAAAGTAGTAAGKSMGSKLMGGFMAIGALALIGKGIQGTVDEATGIAADANKTKRITGDSVEKSSQLNTEFNLSGVDQAKGQSALTIFSKNLGKTTGDAKKTDEMTKQLGHTFYDSTGKILPMSMILGPLSDKFKGMAGGAEKNALAMKLFGKSGLDMLPFLNKGSDALGEMAKKSDEFGLTVNDQMVKDMGAAKSEAREFDAQVRGLKVSFGAALLPVMTAVHSFMHDYLIPVLASAADYIKKNKDWIVPLVAGLLAVWGAFKIGTIVVGAFNAIIKANVFVKIALVLIAIGLAVKYAYDHFQGFHDFIDTAWSNIKGWFASAWAVIEPILQRFWKWLQDVGAAAMLLWENNIKPAFIQIGQKAQELWENNIKPAFGWIRDHIHYVGEAAMWLWDNIIKPYFTAIGNFISWMVTNVWLPAFRWIADNFHYVGEGATALWNDYLKPAFTWIGEKAKWLWENAIKPAFGWIRENFHYVGEGASALWNDYLKPAFQFIGEKAMWLWENAIKPAFGFIKENIHYVGDTLSWLWENVVSPVAGLIWAIIKKVGAVFLWLWQNAIGPAIGFIWKAIQWAWQNVISPVLGFILKIIGAVGAVFLWLWQHVVFPVWKWIAGAIKWAWENVIEPVIKWLTNAINNTGDTFHGLWNTVSSVWTSIKNFLGGLFSGVKNAAVNVFNWFKDLPGNIWDKIMAAKDWVLTKGGELIGWIKSGIDTGATAVWTFFTSLPGTVWDKIVAAKDTVLAKGGEFIGWIKSGIDTGAEAIWTFFSDLPGKALDALTNISKDILNLGVKFVGWIVEGVVSVAQNIWNAITNALAGTQEQGPADDKSDPNGDPAGKGHYAGGGRVKPRGGMQVRAAGGTVWGGAAGDGLFRGAGGERQDLNHVLISDNEFVVNANSTRKHLPLIEAINADRFATGGMLGTQEAAVKYGSDGAWKAANKRIDEIKSGTADASGFDHSAFAGLTGEQAANARAIASVADSRGLGALGVLVGIVTALTESTLINVAHGDAMGPSSTGLFQQMPPWGPYAVRMSPTGSAGLFYDALVALNPPWTQQSVQMAAQHVEQSEFSDGSNYAGNMAAARGIVAGLGYSLGAGAGSSGGGSGGAPKPRGGGMRAVAGGGLIFDGGGLWPSGVLGANTSGGPEAVLTTDEKADYKTHARALSSGAAGNTITVAPGAVSIVVQGDLKNAAQVRAELERALRQILSADQSRRL